MKSIILFAAVGVIFFVIEASDYSKYGASTPFYFRRVTCDFSLDSALANYSCFAKSYNRMISTLNVNVPFKKPLKKIFVSNTINFELMSEF